MRTFPTEEVLVAAYWRQLASSIGATHKSRGGAFARRAARGLETRRRRSRGYGALAREAATETLRRRVR
jgi:hypothetical protein